MISSKIKDALPEHKNVNESTRNRCFEIRKFCEWLNSLFELSNKTCCCSWYGGKYTISKPSHVPRDGSAINDVEKSDSGKTNTKCATKSICYLVAVLFLVFVAAGAILLYQSRK